MERFTNLRSPLATLCVLLLISSLLLLAGLLPDQARNLTAQSSGKSSAQITLHTFRLRVMDRAQATYLARADLVLQGLSTSGEYLDLTYAVTDDAGAARLTVPHATSGFQAGRYRLLIDGEVCREFALQEHEILWPIEVKALGKAELVFRFSTPLDDSGQLDDSADTHAELIHGANIYLLRGVTQAELANWESQRFKLAQRAQEYGQRVTPSELLEGERFSLGPVARDALIVIDAGDSWLPTLLDVRGARVLAQELKPEPASDEQDDDPPAVEEEPERVAGNPSFYALDGYRMLAQDLRMQPAHSLAGRFLPTSPLHPADSVVFTIEGKRFTSDASGKFVARGLPPAPVELIVPHTN